MNKGIDYCGYVKSYDPKTKLAEIEQRNYFKVGDTLEVFGPHVDNYKFKVEKIYDKDMVEIEKANHPLMKIYLEIDSDVKEHFMIRNLK